MADKTYDLHSVKVYECAAEGAPLRTDRDAVDLIGKLFETHSNLVVLPTGRLGDDFFELKTGIAGEFIQIFGIYGLRVAIVGDISRHVAESELLRDCVQKSNSGDQVWFLPSLDELDERLAGLEQP
ncbi:MAG TPA: DUF4180 domain-containing protein [Candidatus Eremiobacteraceae bacterium]